MRSIGGYFLAGVGADQHNVGLCSMGLRARAAITVITLRLSAAGEGLGQDNWERGARRSISGAVSFEVSVELQAAADGEGGSVRRQQFSLDRVNECFEPFVVSFPDEERRELGSWQRRRAGPVAPAAAAGSHGAMQRRVARRRNRSIGLSCATNTACPPIHADKFLCRVRRLPAAAASLPHPALPPPPHSTTHPPPPRRPPDGTTTCADKN